MGGKLRAVVSATAVVALLVIAPTLVVMLVPEIEAQAPFLGIDVGGFVRTLALVGAALAFFSVVKNMTGDRSPANLAANLLSSFVGLYLFLFLVGLGDPSGFGLTERNLKVGTGVRMYWDLRFAVTLYLIIMLLGIMKTLVNFVYARRERLAS